MSKIAWTEKTWNPVVGCTKVSDGCRFCYAEKESKRQVAMGHARHVKNPDSDETAWIKYSTVIDPDTGKWNNAIYCDESALTELTPRQSPKMIFVCSMGDLFHKDVPFDFIVKVMAVMASCPQHTFQVLTKRPERMIEWINIPFQHVKLITAIKNHLRNMGQVVPDDTMTIEWPLPNLWIGPSASNQKDLDKNVPHLLQTPAAVRLLSIEPLLEGWLIVPLKGVRYKKGIYEEPKIHWVIIGAESKGSHPGRECRIEWVRSIVRQCQTAGVKVFVKQLHMWRYKNRWGNYQYFETAEDAYRHSGGCEPKRVLIKYPKDKNQFPTDLRLWQMPERK